MEEKYFRIPVDTYTLALDNVKKPKYAGAFKEYIVAACTDTNCYIRGRVSEKYYEKLIKKDDVSEFSKEDFELALERLI